MVTSAYVHTSDVATTESTAYVQSHSRAHSSTATPSSGSSKGHQKGKGGKPAVPPGSDKDDGKVGVPYYYWDAGETFLGTYLAILVAVINRMLWTMVFNSFTLIDPFLQLMEPGGALAERAFFSFYQAQFNLLGPFPALLKQRWALGLVATTYLVACLLPALASESIFVSTNWNCPDPNLNVKNNQCAPKVFGNIIVLRILQGLLGFAGVVLLGLTSLLLFKKSGLPDDPRSIATLASLMRHPRLVDELNAIPVNATSEETKHMLQGKRYQLGSYKYANGDEAYGIRPAIRYEDVSYVSHSSSLKHKYTPIEGSLGFAEQGSLSQRPFRIMDGILIFFTLGTFGVVLAYRLDYKKDGFNDFFNSGGFGARFILTLAGTVVATLWKSVEQSCVVMAPYSRLANGPSRADSTILFTPSTTPISSTVRSFRHGYFFVTAITIVTLSADLGLNIVISGIPYATGETWQQFLVSTYMSLAILGIMIIVIAFLIFARFREPRIPRQPTTLGAAMSYMSGSRMICDFEGMEYFDQKTRNDRINLIRKKYEFKEMMRRDGKIGWTVDESSSRYSY